MTVVVSRWKTMPCRPSLRRPVAAERTTGAADSKSGPGEWGAVRLGELQECVAAEPGVFVNDGEVDEGGTGAFGIGG